MRSFSDLEKQIVRKMIELDEAPGSFNVLANILYTFSNDSHLPDYCYIHVRTETDVAIMVRSEARKEHDGTWLTEVDGKISRLLLTTVKLFEFLERNELAFFIGDYDIKTLGETWVDTPYDRCEFLEPESKALIYKYTRKKVYVSESLKELSKNDFKPPDQIRYEREVLATRIALGVTFAGLIASILVPVLGTTAVRIQNNEIVVSPGGPMSQLIEANSGAVTAVNGSVELMQKELSRIDEGLAGLRKYAESIDVEGVHKRIRGLDSEVAKLRSALENKHNRVRAGI
jgi:hypothetical protein